MYVIDGTVHYKENNEAKQKTIQISQGDLYADLDSCTILVE